MIRETVILKFDDLFFSRAFLKHKNTLFLAKFSAPKIKKKQVEKVILRPFLKNFDKKKRREKKKLG